MAELRTFKGADAAREEMELSSPLYSGWTHVCFLLVQLQLTALKVWGLADDLQGNKGVVYGGLEEAEKLLCPGNASGHETAPFSCQPHLPSGKHPLVEAAAEGRASGGPSAVPGWCLAKKFHDHIVCQVHH